jgi:pimeloyl-ACP methyl ester carboxylesterase
MTVTKKALIGILITLLILIVGAQAWYFYNTKIVESKKATESSPETTQYMAIGPEQIAYQEINNHASTTVLFVGGLSAWNGTWARVMQAANKNGLDFNYIAIDLPPFGYSTIEPNSGYFRDKQANRISQFIENMKLSHLIIAAHSYGAGPSAEYALQHSEKVVKLIIIDGVLNIDEQKTSNTIPLINCDYLRNLLIGLLIHNEAFGISKFKSFVYLTGSIDKDLFENYSRPFDTIGTTQKLSYWLRDYANDPLTHKSNFSANYKGIPFPVRLIWGNKDTLTPMSGTEILLQTIPNVRLYTLDGVGHIPMIENPEKFDAALLDSLTH